MTTTTFGITWDYRCPYARNAHEHVVEALRAGAPWEVQFVPFSLDQAHVEDGATPVWDAPDRYPGLLANAVGIVLRDRYPEQFLDAHLALFAARHDHSLDTRNREVLTEVLAGQGIEAGAVFDAVDDGWPLEAFRKEHQAAVDEHRVFGVPTFVVGDRATFVRLLTRPRGDAGLARTTIDRVVDLMAGSPDLNEFKDTSIPR
ncbi:MAG TPA: DsbA family protein [Acidimicrobiales bacterium]|nr:DsbA family protein [Acidimicrobiales bacterium]